MGIVKYKTVHINAQRSDYLWSIFEGSARNDCYLLSMKNRHSNLRFLGLYYKKY